MSIRKRALLGASTFAALALIVSGCSSAPEGGENADGSVTLTIWHNTQDSQAIKNIYADYEKDTGNKIVLVDIPSDGFEDATLTKWASGDRPDVLEFHASREYINLLNPKENLQPLDGMDFIARSGSLYDLGGTAADGTVYAAITNFPSVWGLYYSKPLLEQFGFEPATTLEELTEQCATFSAAGIPTLAESAASVWPPITMQHLVNASLVEPEWTQKVVDRETTLDAPDSPVLAGLNAYKGLLDAGCLNKDVTTATFENAVSMVYNGEAAYQAIHSNVAPVYADAAGGDDEALGAAVGFTAFGANEKMTVVSAGPIGTFHLPKTGDPVREEAARGFLEYVTGEHYDKYIADSGTFPVLDGVADPTNATPLMKDIKAAYDEGPTAGLVASRIPGGMSTMTTLLSQLIVGEITPEEAAKQLQQQVEIAAKAQGLEGW